MIRTNRENPPKIGKSRKIGLKKVKKEKKKKDTRKDNKGPVQIGKHPRLKPPPPSTGP